MMLVGLAEHNQPQRQSEPDLVPLLPHSPKTSSCHLQEAQLARLLSVSACEDSLSRRRSTTTTTSDHLRQAYRLRPPILSTLNNDRLAFPNQSHARDSKLRKDSWAR